MRKITVRWKSKTEARAGKPRKHQKIECKTREMSDRTTIRRSQRRCRPTCNNNVLTKVLILCWMLQLNAWVNCGLNYTFYICNIVRFMGNAMRDGIKMVCARSSRYGQSRTEKNRIKRNGAEQSEWVSATTTIKLLRLMAMGIGSIAER